MPIVPRRLHGGLSRRRCRRASRRPRAPPGVGEQDHRCRRSRRRCRPSAAPRAATRGRGRSRARRGRSVIAVSSQARVRSRWAPSWTVSSSSERMISRLRGVGGQLRGQAARQPDLFGDSGQDRLEVERHHAAARRDRRALVVDHAQQLLVRGAVRVLPQRLHLGLRERLARGVVGELSHAARDRPGETPAGRAEARSAICFSTSTFA